MIKDWITLIGLSLLGGAIVAWILNVIIQFLS